MAVGVDAGVVVDEPVDNGGCRGLLGPVFFRVDFKCSRVFFLRLALLGGVLG